MTAKTELEELRRDVQHLRDIEEIKQLRAAFARACDGDLVDGPTHDFETLSNLFTDDGSWLIATFDANGDPVEAGATGREAIREYFRTAQETVPFAMHLAVLPIIEVMGDQAQGYWRMFATMSTLDGQALWAGADYDETYRRTSEGWRVASSRVTVGFNTPFEDGWCKTRFHPLARNSAR